jgi:hypothetical protein
MDALTIQFTEIIRKPEPTQIIKPFIMKLKREHDTFYKNNYNFVLKSVQHKCYFRNREEQELFLDVSIEVLKERTYLTKYEMKRMEQIYYENHYERLRAILKYIYNHNDIELSTEFEFDETELTLKLYSEFPTRINYPYYRI